MSGQENGARGRADDGTGRTYLGPDGQRWPSVTTLTGLIPGKAEGLARWRSSVGDEAADATLEEAISRGNTIHDAIEAGDGPASVRRWLELHEAVHVASELTLANSVERYAGTADRLGVLTSGVPYVIDWKTGKRRTEHAVQVLGYADSDLQLMEDGAYGGGPAWIPFGEGWSWGRAENVYKDNGAGSAWRPDEDSDGWIWRRHVAALVGYIDRAGGLEVRGVKPGAYEALRAVRRGLRGTWAWNAVPKRGLLERWPA